MTPGKAEEFRLVIDEKTLLTLNPDRTQSSDFTDYYLARGKRVRIIERPSQKSEAAYQLIEVTPGSIVKPKSAITKEQAEEYSRHAILIIAKKGYGELTVPGGYQGYAERVTAYLPGQKDKPAIDEIHIEFELEGVEPETIARTLKHMRIIRQGLYDYISAKVRNI
jgi:hypothetical protein